MFETKLQELIAKRGKIPDEFWVQDHVWFHDAMQGQYDWSAQRLGFNRAGEVVWAYDSGCSCNGAWENGRFDPNECEKIEPKLFKLENFLVKKEDAYRDEAQPTAEEVYSDLEDFLILVSDDPDAQKVLSLKNAEIRRYMIKRIGYEKIKDAVKATVIHKDGDNELLKFENGEMYVKVRDSSTDREYLLFVQGNHKTCRSAIAWTFGLAEHEYAPIIET